MTRFLQAATLLLTAISLVPSGSHMAALPHKIGLGAEDYLTVQHIYAGWAWFGVPMLLDIVLLAVLAIRQRGQGLAANFGFGAFAVMVLSLGAFFVLVYPGNVATNNWTHLPDDWQAVRTRWEYGHALVGTLSLLAFLSLVISVVWRRG